MQSSFTQAWNAAIACDGLRWTRGRQATAALPLEEDWMVWLALLVGVVIGIVSGIVGIGGGVLFIPALIWLFGMDQHKAQGTSLGALLAPVGIFAFLEYHRHGN